MLLNDYYTTKNERLEAEKLAKPLKDREDKLAAEIKAALIEADTNSAKRGSFRATLEDVAGRVSWKNEYDSLQELAIAAGVPVAAPEAGTSTRLTVVPV